MTSMAKDSGSKINTKQLPKAQNEIKKTADHSSTGARNSGSTKTILDMENTQLPYEKNEMPLIAATKTEDRSGVYVNRFGESLGVVRVQYPQTTSNFPTGRGECEIELTTRVREHEICKNFAYGYCQWGERCHRIHRFNMFHEMNKTILQDVFKSDIPEVVCTRANYNEACKLFIEGRCTFDWRCRRIHLISPSRTFVDADTVSDLIKSKSEADSDFVVKLPPSLSCAKSCLPQITSTDTRLSADHSVSDSASNLGSHLSLESRNIPELPEFERIENWGCETEASAWLDTDSDTSETFANSLASSCSSMGSSIHPKHPPPRYSETCRRWLRGVCERGYNCRYVHGDLEYEESISEPRPMAPTIYMATVHDHIRVKFGPGFSVQEVITGFETPWLYINNIPSNVPPENIQSLLSKHGTLQDFRVDYGAQRGTLRARARFSSDIEARNANIVLNGTRQWDSIISTQLPVNTAHGSRATLQDTAVRIEWEAPSIIGYAGYPTEERAREAIAIAKAAYSKRYISAHMYSGLPQMAAYTVRFLNLPIDMTKERMRKYSKPLDMMWDRPNYTSVDEVGSFIRRKLQSNGFDIITFEILPPPYRDGQVRAWVYFSAPAAAKAACQLLHLRRPMCTGRTRMYAYHMQSLSYSIPMGQYKKIEDDLIIFRERLRREVSGTTLTVTLGTAFAAVRLSAIDGKDLGHLKAEFEKLRGGEVVMHNGEVLWDRFFGLPAGKNYLRKLEITNFGIEIRENLSRRRIILFGQPGLREVVKAALVQKHSELLVREKRCFFLGPLIGPFMHFEFHSISERLGPEKVLLDLWNRQLVVSGHNQDFRIALQAVQRIQRKQNPRLHRYAASCPVCLGEVDCPVTLSPCKHSYCRACLISYLQAAIDGKFFPLTCLGNDDNCSSAISIFLARQVLTIGEFDSLIEAAFEAHIHERPTEFYYCPSPDCMQVYRPAPRGNTLQCPSCLLRICPQCHVEQHDGFECPDRDGGDQLFNEWARAHNVKNCPSCRVPIERAEGCNHVTCIRCRTHICWVCMQTFPGGDGIYNHMRAEHGGIGNAFDDDGL